MRASVLMKARGGRASCASRRWPRAATSCRRGRGRCARGSTPAARLLALGNGGSATDAMDVVADFRRRPHGLAGRAPALDLTEDPAILTAIANDIGHRGDLPPPGDRLRARGRRAAGALHQRQLGERDRGAGRGAPPRAATIAMVGYDGGRVAAERLADHVVVTRSEHIPRIQEAQASAYHVLRELVELRRDG